MMKVMMTGIRRRKRRNISHEMILLPEETDHLIEEDNNHLLDIGEDLPQTPHQDTGEEPPLTLHLDIEGDLPQIPHQDTGEGHHLDHLLEGDHLREEENQEVDHHKDLEEVILEVAALLGRRQVWI